MSFHQKIEGPFGDHWEKLLQDALQDYETKPEQEKQRISKAISNFFKNAPEVTPGENITSSIITRIKEESLPLEKIETLYKTILDTTVEKKVPLTSKEKAIASMEPVVFHFFNDTEATDGNAYLMSSLNTLLSSREISIITLSAFLRIHCETGQKETIMKTLLQAQKNHDPYIKDGFLILIPKDMEKGMPEQERLRRLGLREDLEKTTWKQVLSTVDKRPALNNFANLFAERPLRAKCFHLFGHGITKIAIAGIKTWNYDNFLKWMQKQKCRALFISTCYGGGINVLHHLPTKDAESLQKFQPLPEGVPFPVAVQSIGEFVSNAIPYYMQYKMTDFLLNIAESSNRGKSATIPEFSKFATQMDSYHAEHVRGRMQIYFPHAKDSPGGFRPVQSDSYKEYVLTYNRYRKLALEKKAEITVAGKSFLEIFPISMKLPLRFEDENPVLLSMIPGQAHHLLQKVTLDKESFDSFLRRNLSFYKEFEINREKTFFIATLKDENQQLHQVFINMREQKCAFRQDDSYFLWDIGKKSDPQPISPFKFLLYWQKTIDNSKPDEESCRFSTGGQQNEDDFLRNVRSVTFWGAEKETVLDKYGTLLDTQRLDNMEVKEIREMMEEVNLERAEIIDFISYLLFRNKQKLAIALFQQTNLAPNSVDANGVPLLIHAANSDTVEFIKFLAEKGADLNIQDPTTKTRAFEIAALAANDGNTDLFDFLLTQDSLDINAKGSGGAPVFSKAWTKKELLEKCLQKDPRIDFNAGDLSILEHPIHKGYEDVVRFMLEHGTDPNKKTDPPPLKQACYSRNKDIINLLLEYGADPLQNDAEPIKIAMLTCSADRVKLLLEAAKKRGAPLPQEIFVNALKSVDSNKIELALEYNIDPPLSYYLGTDLALATLASVGEFDLIKKMVTRLGERADSLLETLLEISIRESINRLNELIEFYLSLNRADIVKENAESIVTTASKLLNEEQISVDVCRSILQNLEKIGFNCAENLPTNDKNGLFHGLLIENGYLEPLPALVSLSRDNNLAAVKYLLNNKKIGIDLSNPSMKPLLGQAVDYSARNEEIISWLIRQGADTADIDPVIKAYLTEENAGLRRKLEQQPPEAVASSVKKLLLNIIISREDMDALKLIKDKSLLPTDKEIVEILSEKNVKNNRVIYTLLDSIGEEELKKFIEETACSWYLYDEELRAFIEQKGFGKLAERYGLD